MILSILICVATEVWLLLMLRRAKLSLGLPVAYLFALHLIHVPGAVAHLFDDTRFLIGLESTAIGIRLTAIASVAFVAGVWIARTLRVRLPEKTPADRRSFWTFAVLGGWGFTYGLSSLRQIPTLGAGVDKAGGIWMLGVMLGLRDAVRRRNRAHMALWLAALAVFPLVTLMFSGFLSYGSTAVIVVLASLTITARSIARVFLTTAVAVVLGVSLFVTYFQNRTELRETVWGGAALEDRVDVSAGLVTNFQLFDFSNREHLLALDMRLNQNYFAGRAAARLKNGEVEYLRGASIVEGVLALVPRALWPGKPIYAGSPKIVGEMTGLTLSQTTSFGVGNVMEFHINFGIPGVLLGFAVLGFGLAWLDRRAAICDASGNVGRTVVFFLPAVALIQPNGSFIELIGGAGAAFFAAKGWEWVWAQRSRKLSRAPAFHHAPLPDRR